MENVASEHALALISGDAEVFGSIVDSRVDRLRRLIAKLDTGEKFPNPYEVGALFRITPSQAKTLIATYKARHSADHRDRMRDAMTNAVAVPEEVKKQEVWTIQFDDPVALEHAAELLKRRGLSRTVEADGVNLTLTVARDVTDRFGSDAVKALGCKVKAKK